MNSTLNTWLRRGILGGLFLATVAPALVTGTLFFPFITGKNFFFRIIVEIVLALWAILALRDPAYRPKRSVVLWSLGIFVAVIGIADAFGVNAYRSFWSVFERMEGFIGLLHLAAYFLVMISVMKSEAIWRKYFHAILGTTLFLTVYAVLQSAGVFAIDQGNVRIDSTLGNAAYFAIYLLFSIFLTAIYFLKSKEKDIPGLVNFSLLWGHVLLFIQAVQATGIFSGDPAVQVQLSKASIALFAWVAVSALIHVIVWAVFSLNKPEHWARFFYIQLLVLQIYCMYWTATRGAILALLGGAVLVAIFAAYRSGPRMRKAALGVLGTFAVLVAVFVGIRNTSFVQGSPVLRRFASFNEATITSRAIIWKMGWEGFKEHPILGWGQENYNVVFNKYYDPQLWEQEQWFDRAHNVFLDWLTAGGILGLLGYLALFCSGFYVLIHPRRSDFAEVERVLFGALLLAYFAQNLTVFDNLTSYMLFFSVLAYIHVRGETLSLGKESKGFEIPEGVQWGGAAVVLVVLVLGMWNVTIRPFMVARDLIAALKAQKGGAQVNFDYFKKVFAADTFGNAEGSEQAMVFASQVLQTTELPEQFRKDVAVMAYEAMSKTIAANPNDARYRYFMGTFMRRLGPNASAQAEAELKKAVELSPNKQQLIIELGTYYLGVKDYPKALEQMKRAYELDTNYDDARRIYALAAIYADDYKLAASILAPKYDTIAIDDDRFASAFLTKKDYANLIKLGQGRVAQKPEDARLHMALGAYYQQAGQTQNAFKEYREAVKLDPSLKAQIEQQSGLTL